MDAHGAAAPAFGTADLSNCEREQIQLAGSIQPHGALLVVREPDLTVIQASEGAVAFLELDAAPLGRTLHALGGDLAERIAPHLDEPLRAVPLAITCRVGRLGTERDCLIHRPPEGGLVVELERVGPRVELSQQLEPALRAIVTASSLRALADETAAILKALTGYDRVMVYRFDETGNGEVFSERREPELEAYLGNRYPASDIPQIARRLYERNRIRVLVDVERGPEPLTPRLSPITGRDLDMSMCFLRSMSPIHLQYLKNMGVRATLVISLMVGGRLWGLIACHHYAPRFVHFETRAMCEVLAEVVATRIAALESFVLANAELKVRRLEQRMLEAITRNGDWRAALLDDPAALLDPVAASGAALLFDGQIMTVGEVPGSYDLREIAAWLDARPHAPLHVSASLGIDAPKFAPLKAMASGVLAAALSAAPGEYLIWFRPERIRTVTWGGDPMKAVVVGDNPLDLSPRRSFAQWHQVVENTAEPWSPADLAAARLIGETTAGVIVQSRSVRMLIAQDQLDNASRQMHMAEQPVVIADQGGRILLVNEALEQLLGRRRRELLQLTDLPSSFADPPELRGVLRELVDERRSWRGELNTAGGRPILLQADPVMTPPDRVLGFVLLLSDVAEQKAAEAARRAFQEGILEPQAGSGPGARLDSRADLVYRNLLSAVIENAQLAALEITDGEDVAQMPSLLDSVRASVDRTAKVLRRLIWHSSESPRRRRP